MLSGFLATRALCAPFIVPVVVAQEGQQKPDAQANSKQACEQDTQSKQTPRDPIEQSDDLKTKVTLGIYFVPGGRTYDINARHQFGHLTAWVAGYFDPRTDSLARIGAQYDCQYKWIHFVPTLELASTRAVAGSLYTELGGQTYAIVGISRTNLKPFFDLFWDPSESAQLGLGRKINSYDRVTAYAIFDVRLHTGQQNSHILWRHRLNANNGITFDALFKSGHTDEHNYVRAFGFGIY